MGDSLRSRDFSTLKRLLVNRLYGLTERITTEESDVYPPLAGPGLFTEETSFTMLQRHEATASLGRGGSAIGAENLTMVGLKLDELA